MVTKGKMPPKHFTDKHPDGVPSKEEIKTICDWAQQPQVVNKKKLFEPINRGKGYRYKDEYQFIPSI